MAIVVSCAVLAAMTSCSLDEQESREATQELRRATDRIRELHPVKPDSARSPVILDVRQLDEKKFVETRLRYVGKNLENSPNLFTRLERNSQASKIGQTQREDSPECDAPLSVTQDPTNINRFIARIITSCFAGADYSYVDLFWWNALTGEILKYDFREDFTNPTDITLEIFADAAEIGNKIRVDSMAVNSKNLEDIYIFGDVFLDRPSTVVGRDTITHPKDGPDADAIVTSCLDRNSPLDCDYYYTGTNGNLMMPISMSFRFPKSVQSVVSVTAQVHMNNSGGVCKTVDLQTHATKAAAVVSVVTKDPFGNLAPISFGTRCVATQAQVRFWIKVVALDTSGKVYEVFWANDLKKADGTADPTNFALRFIWSCLAEGSKIVMADGTEKSVETVGMGDRVRSGARGEWLSVVDVTSGFESAPIVELESDNGGILLVTQGHPFFDADGKALRADELKVGSTIKTSSGTAKITKLNRKPYAGKVYNLKLGTEQQIQGLDVGAINMYANGFSVGDSRSQLALEMLRMQQAASRPMKEEWKQDYLMTNVRNFFVPRVVH